MSLDEKFKKAPRKFWVGLLALFLIIFLSNVLKNPSLFSVIAIILILFFLFKNNFIPKIKKNMSEQTKVVNVGRNAKYIVWVIVAVILMVILVANSLVVIKAGETGVYHLFGKVKDRELESGLHLINPLANVTDMSIRTEAYTMSIVHTEGQRTGPDEIVALTKEGLDVALDITVLYHLDQNKASDVYLTVGEDYEEKIIRPEIRSVIREVIAWYEAKDIYSEKRGEAATNILSKLRENTGERGILIEDVLLRNVILPQTLSDSIEQKLSAEQEAQRYDFVLQTEEKEAERKRIEAAGQRDAQKIINESLTPNYLNYLYIQNLKENPNLIYIPTGSDNGLPLFKNVP